MVNWLPDASEVDQPGSSSASVAGVADGKNGGDGEVRHWVLGGGDYGPPLPSTHYLHPAAHCQSDKSGHLVPSFCAFQHNRDQTVALTDPSIVGTSKRGNNCGLILLVLDVW